MGIPKTFNEAVADILNSLSNADCNYIKQLSPEKAKSVGHHTVGRSIRNDWGLWSGDGDLFHNLKQLGFTHPDDMSGAIINAVVCKVREEDFDLNTEIQRYKEYWANAMRNEIGQLLDGIKYK